MTTTYVSTFTRTHTANFLSDLILGTIGDILAALGISATRLYRNWQQDQSAIKAWIEEGSLSMVIVECHQPGGRVSPIIEFPVVYDSYAIGDAHFTEDHAAIARFRAKLEYVPAGTSYRILCSYYQTPSSQPGWESATRASTDGLRATSMGTIGAAPHAATSMRYLR